MAIQAHSHVHRPLTRDQGIHRQNGKRHAGPRLGLTFQQPWYGQRDTDSVSFLNKPQGGSGGDQDRDTSSLVKTTEYLQKEALAADCHPFFRLNCLVYHPRTCVCFCTVTYQTYCPAYVPFCVSSTSQLPHISFRFWRYRQSNK